jgi:hypothetical protein
MEEESEIRRPDEAKVDRLFSSSNHYFPTDYQYRQQFAGEDDDNDIKRILEESERDFEFQFAVLESERMARERDERATHYAGFLNNIKRFAKIDKSNESFYLELIEYIELYERGEVEIVNVGQAFYTKFTRTIDNMRITADERSRLYQFIRLLETR